MNHFGLKHTKAIALLMTAAFLLADISSVVYAAPEDAIVVENVIDGNSGDDLIVGNDMQSGLDSKTNISDETAGISDNNLNVNTDKNIDLDSNKGDDANTDLNLGIDSDDENADLVTDPDIDLKKEQGLDTDLDKEPGSDADSDESEDEKSASIKAVKPMLKSSGMLLGASSPYVASVTINGTVNNYTTIKEAFNAANSASSDCEIKLLANCSSTSRLSINNASKKKITLNLNIYTLEIIGSNNDNEANCAMSIATPLDIVGDSSNNGKLRLTNYYYGLCTTASTVVNIYDGANIYANTSGTSNTRMIVIRYGTLNFYGGTMYTEKATLLSMLVTCSKINIYNGTFHWNPSNKSWGGCTDSFNSNGSRGMITIYGGYYDGRLWCGDTTVTNYYHFIGGYYTLAGINTNDGEKAWAANLDAGVNAETLNPPVTIGGTTYYYRIHSIDCSASTACSEMGTAFVDKQSLKAGDTATFTATPVTGYQFLNWTDPNGTQISTTNPYLRTVVEADRAKGVNLTAHFVPIAPTGLTLSSVTNDSMTITWNSPVANYLLYIATDESFNNCLAGYNGKLIPASSSSTTSQTVSGLSAGTTYYIRVAAKNPETGLAGPYSVAVSEKTLFKVTFNYSGHGTNFDVMGKVDSLLMNAVGSTWSSTLAPTAPGCIFLDWCTDATLSTSANLSNTTTITKDCTYYAKWHEHAWKYESISTTEGGKIVAYCTNASNPCDYYGDAGSHGDSVYITMSANNATYTGSMYLDSNITLTGDTNFNTVTEQSLGKSSIRYYTNPECTTETDTLSSGAGAASAGGAPKNVGTYYAKLAVMEGTNEVASIVSKFDITKADSSITTYPTAVTNLIYDGSPKTLINPGSASGGTLMYLCVDNPSIDPADLQLYSATVPQRTATGEVKIYYYVKGDSNHKDIPAGSPITVSIGKATRLTIAPTMQNYTYEQTTALPTPGTNPARTDAVVFEENPDVTFFYNTSNSNVGGTEWKDMTSDSLAVGDYWMYAVVSATDSYNEYTTSTCAFSVSATPCTVTQAPVPRNLTYNEAEQFLVSAGEVHGGTMQYCMTEVGEYSETIPTRELAETYTVYYKGVGDSNHTNSAVGSVTVTIKKANATLSKAPASKTLTYTGSPLSLVDEGEAYGGTMQYKLDTETSYTDAIPTGTDAGEYNVNYYIKGDDNHNDTAPQTVAVTVQKADCSVTAPSAKSLVYTRTAQDLVNAGIVSGGTMEYSLTGAEGSFSTTIPKGTEKGDYTVYYRVVGDSNHKDIPAGAPITVSIEKTTRSEIAVTMQSYTYGQTTAIPAPDTNPARTDDVVFEEDPNVTFFYNTSDSNVGGTEWKDMTSTSLKAGTYWMYANVSATTSYQEYTTNPVEFTIAKTSEYIVEAPVGNLTYRQHLSRATLDGGRAYVSGSATSLTGAFDWKDDTVGAIEPHVSDSDSTLYDMTFTPSGDDADNYLPKECQAKVNVAPKLVDPLIEAKVSETGAVTETITDDDGTILVEGRDYEKQVTSVDKGEYTEYKVDYTFMNDYTGTKSKKLSVPKETPGKNPNDVIISSVEAAPKAESTFEPEMKPVSYSDAKVIINEDIEKIASDASDSRQGEAVAIITKLETQPNDIVYDAQITLEMDAKEEEDVDTNVKASILGEAKTIPNVSEDIRYIDISVYLLYTVTDMSTGTEVVRTKQPIHDTGEKVETIVIKAPSDLPPVASHQERTYYIVREHEGDSQIIATSNTPEIAFSSSLFSTYALLYADRDKPVPVPPGGDDKPLPSDSYMLQMALKNKAGANIVPVFGGSYKFVSPKTSDTKEIYVFTALMVVGAAAVVMALKKRKSK